MDADENSQGSVNRLEKVQASNVKGLESITAQDQDTEENESIDIVDRCEGDDVGLPLPMGAMATLFEGEENSGNKNTFELVQDETETGPLHPSAVENSIQLTDEIDKFISTRDQVSSLPPPVPFALLDVEDSDDKVRKKMSVAPGTESTTAPPSDARPVHIESKVLGTPRNDFSREDSIVHPPSDDAPEPVITLPFQSRRAREYLGLGQNTSNSSSSSANIEGDEESNQLNIESESDFASVSIAPVAVAPQASPGSRLHAEELSRKDSMPVISTAFAVDNEVIVGTPLDPSDPTPSLPWWKETKSRVLFGSVFAVVAGLSIALVFSFSSKNSDTERIATNTIVLQRSPPPSLSATPSSSPSTISPAPSITSSLLPSYSRLPSLSPLPSHHPTVTSPPSREHGQVLLTGSSKDLQSGSQVTTSYGYTWNIRTKPDAGVVLLTGFDFYTRSNEDVDFELWTRMGSYRDFRGCIEGWDLIASGTTRGRGIGQYTAIPEETFTPVSIPGGGGEGGTRAFYITLDSNELVYKLGKKGTDPDSNHHAETPDIEVWEGEGVLWYPWPDPEQDNGVFYRAPRQYLGRIYYNRLPCRPFSLHGVVGDLPCPLVPTGSPTAPFPSQSPITIGSSSNGNQLAAANPASAAASSAHYCGLDWLDADFCCRKACPTGEDNECADGHQCYYFTSCDAELGEDRCRGDGALSGSG